MSYKKIPVPTKEEKISLIKVNNAIYCYVFYTYVQVLKKIDMI